MTRAVNGAALLFAASAIAAPPRLDLQVVMRLVRRESLTPNERARLAEETSNPNGHVDSVELPEVLVLAEMARVIGPRNVRACKPAPPGKPSIKLNLKPAAKIADLIAWIASVTCKQFLLPEWIPPDSRRVTVVAPQLITPEEAHELFLETLDSVGLTVDGSGNVPRIVDRVDLEPLVTRLVRVEHVDPHEVVQILERIKSVRGKIALSESTGAILITDLPENVQRMMRVLSQT